MEKLLSVQEISCQFRIERIAAYRILREKRKERSIQSFKKNKCKEYNGFQGSMYRKSDVEKLFEKRAREESYSEVFQVNTFYPRFKFENKIGLKQELLNYLGIS